MVFLLFALWFIQETCNTLLTSTIVKIKSNICGFKITLSYSSFVQLICFFILWVCFGPCQRHLHLDWLLGLLSTYDFTTILECSKSISPQQFVYFWSQYSCWNSLHSACMCCLWFYENYIFWYHHADLSNLADFDDKPLGFATSLGNSRREGALLDIIIIIYILIDFPFSFFVNEFSLYRFPKVCWRRLKQQRSVLKREAWVVFKQTKPGVVINWWDK